MPGPSPREEGHGYFFIHAAILLTGQYQRAPDHTCGSGTGLDCLCWISPHRHVSRLQRRIHGQVVIHRVVPLILSDPFQSSRLGGVLYDLAISPCRGSDSSSQILHPTSLFNADDTAVLTRILLVARTLSSRHSSWVASPTATTISSRLTPLRCRMPPRAARPPPTSELFLASPAPTT